MMIIKQKPVVFGNTTTYILPNKTLLNLHVDYVDNDIVVDNFYSKSGGVITGKTIVWDWEPTKEMVELGYQLINGTRAYVSVSVWADCMTDRLERVYDEYNEVIVDITTSELETYVNAFINEAMEELQ